MRRLNTKKAIDKAILNFLNLLFGSSEKSATFWKITFTEGVTRRFIVATTNEEYHRNVEYLEKAVLVLDSDEEKLLLFQRIQQLVGLAIHSVDSNTTLDPHWVSNYLHCNA